ncbi:MAG: hypothetical protein V3U25_04290 [Nitrososphaerales archaeon]
MLNLQDKVYWFRVLMGIVGGALTAFLIGSAEIIPQGTGFVSVNSSEIAFRGITILMFMYLVSYYLAKFVIAPQLPKEQSRKWATAGIGSFIAIFWWTWILLTTLRALSL